MNMSGLDKILERINEKAEKQREEILEEARQKAEDKKSEGREEAELEKEKIIQKGKQEADREKRRIIANAQAKVRRKELETREELIQEAFENARKELSKLKNDEEEYQDILEDLIKSGGITVGGGKLRALVSEDDEELLSNKLVKNLEKEIKNETGKETSIKVEPELEDSCGGVIVEKGDGSVRCDNTFEARLSRMKSEIRTKIAEVLFET